MSCPICGKQAADAQVAAKYRPFCSKRCADIDLGRWLNEDYRMPASDEDEVPPNADDSVARWPN